MLINPPLDFYIQPGFVIYFWDMAANLTRVGNKDTFDGGSVHLNNLMFNADHDIIDLSC